MRILHDGTCIITKQEEESAIDREGPMGVYICFSVCSTCNKNVYKCGGCERKGKGFILERNL